MRRRPLHRLWIVLALLFLAEAWLWDHLEPIVARVVNLFPWGKLKEKLARLIENLPPWATLFVFVVPFIVMLPLKFLEVYFLATRNWLGAIGVIIFVKLVGLGVTAFIFDVTRDKLMQMAWFRRMYDWVIGLRDWAHTITEPVRERVRQLTWLLKPQRAGRFLRRFMHLRRNTNRNRTA
jgi:ABC-type transport system involved in cytochrome bd biosynthesis fused ATPase/permease subunit